MHDIRRVMRSVAADLWRVPQPEQPEPAGEERADEASAPTEADFDAVWQAVDNPVDWTELLANPAQHPTLAALAPDVLAGNPDAYRRALGVILPMADLAPYMTDCTVAVTDADTLAVAYRALTDAADRRRACGLALRAARDLLAALPVFTVRVEAVHQDGMVLRAAFTRDSLRRVRIAVADPEQLAADCGTWSKE